MNNRILHLFIFTILYFSFSIAFTSCCNGDYFSRLKGINHFSSWQPDNELNQYSDTITRPFQLYIYFESEQLVHNQQENLLTVAYAMQPCPRTIVNPIDYNSIKLTLDKDFIYIDETIKKGNSLLDLGGILLHHYIETDAMMIIKIDSSFLNKAQFNKEWYNFNISMMNFDTIPELFTAGLPLFMDM